MDKGIRMGRYFKRWIGVLLITVLLASFSLPTLAAASESADSNDRSIRVGFFEFDGYHNIDETGRRSGYGYEFIQKMLRYNNYSAKYVGYDKNWSDMQKMLENGEIDILTSAQKTPDREEKFDFSDEIGTSAAILTVKSGNEKYRAGEYETYNGMHVGVIEGNSRNASFQELAKDKGFSYVLEYYKNMDRLTQDLQDGKIDAIVTSNLRSTSNEWILDKFAVSPFYAMVKKGNTQLLNKIDYAIDQMNSNSVGWQDELFSKYYSGKTGESIALSSTERSYLESLRDSQAKIRVLVHPDRAPYSYQKNGQAKGIIPNVFEEVARRLDLPYEYVTCETRAEYAALKEGGTVDVVLEARNDLSEFEDMGYKLTDPYMTLAYSAVERSDFSGEPKRVATIKEGYTSDHNFQNLIVGKEVLHFDSLSECVDAVLHKQADVCYMYDYSGQQFSIENVRGNLQSTTIPNLKDSMTFAVKTSDDYRLLAVLNKGVVSVATNYVDDAIKANTDFSIGNLSLGQFLWRNPILMLMLGLMCVAMVFSILYGMQKKKSQKRVQEKNEELEQTKESLKEALEAANQASESKGNFLSNMSHEIRTPLNAIIGYLTLARDPAISEEKRKHCIDNCDVASRHLLQIINDVLDMSSIESGKLKISHEDFDLKKEITDITTIFFQNARTKGVLFETHVDGVTEEWVVGDQLRLNQVLMNLLSNAVKFTAENGLVQLHVKQIREDEKKVFLQFSVSDNGIGMSKEYMARIFKPFEQENAGTAKKFGGSGLGLSITNNLVRMMGGKISVNSVQDQGTTFTVTMFFDKSTVHHETLSDQTDYSRVRILVVDDREDDCTYVKAMLKRCGVKSDTVTSGEKALRQIKSRMGGDYSYDLCIIDWNMPGMDGCEVTRRIRQEIGLDVPIIIATAYDIAEFQDEAKVAGVNKIVAKPLFQSTLFDILVSNFGLYHPKSQVDADAAKIDMTGVRLLLAEDNPMNMDIAVTMLEKAGILVDQALNGEEAYKIFTSKPEGTYDLVLMDVQMPVMDGYEATRMIRTSTHPEAKTIPIIAMTANAFAEDVAEALANGMDAHIAKPINYDKLFEILKKYSRRTNKQ